MSRRVLSRRRFLVVVGGAGGALALSGRVRAERAHTAPGPPRAGSVSGPDMTPWADPALSAHAAQASVQVGKPVAVNVAAGFVDATSWNDALLTLRPGGSTGMLVRSELVGRDHPVTVPDGFAGRCLGSWGGLMVIGGHRVVNTGTFTFEAGEPYDTLLAQAGQHAQALAAQPGRPTVKPYRHVYVERFPAVLVTRDLSEWKHLDVPLSAGTGGSFGAVLERGGVLAGDHYAVAEVPDSVIEASLVTLAGALRGRTSTARGAIPLDHGALWGASDTGASDLVIVADRAGTRGYDNRNRVALTLGGDDILLGVNAAGGALEAAVQTKAGTRKIERVQSGLEKQTRALSDTALIKHRVSPTVTIAAPDGKHSLIPNTNIAQDAPES